MKNRQDEPDGNKERLIEKIRQTDGRKTGQTRHSYRNSYSDRDRLECKEIQKYRDSYSDRDRLECKEKQKYRYSYSDRDRLECKEIQKYRDSYSDRDRLECKEKVPAQNAPLSY